MWGNLLALVMSLYKIRTKLSTLYLCADKIRAFEFASNLFQVDLAAGASLRYASLGIRLLGFEGANFAKVLLSNIVSIEESRDIALKAYDQIKG